MRKNARRRDGDEIKGNTSSKGSAGKLFDQVTDDRRCRTAVGSGAAFWSC